MVAYDWAGLENLPILESKSDAGTDVSEILQRFPHSTAKQRL